MNELIFSILRYEPSLVSGEKINLGAIFYHPDSDYRDFFSISKWSRVSSFDDTVNIPLLKDLMLDIHDEIGTPLTNPHFDINSFCLQYDSEIYFDTCTTFTNVPAEKLSSQIEEIKQMYFQFEYDISNRPKKDEQKKFLRRLLKEHGVRYEIDHRDSGAFGTEIDYDFVFDNYGIVIFNLNHKVMDNKTMNKVKAFAWNSSNRKDQYELIVLYSAEDENRPDIQPALRIFRSITTHTINVHNNGFSDLDNILSRISNVG